MPVFWNDSSIGGSRTFLSDDFGSKEKKQQKWNGMAWGFQFLINTSKRCSNCMRQRISNLSLGYKKALAGDYNFEARSVRRAVLRRLKSTVPSFLFFQGTLTSWKKCSVGASSKRYIVEDISSIISRHLPVHFQFPICLEQGVDHYLIYWLAWESLVPNI